MVADLATYCPFANMHDQNSMIQTRTYSTTPTYPNQQVDMSVDVAKRQQHLTRSKSLNDISMVENYDNNNKANSSIHKTIEPTSNGLAPNSNVAIVFGMQDALNSNHKDMAYSRFAAYNSIYNPVAMDGIADQISNLRL